MHFMKHPKQSLTIAAVCLYVNLNILHDNQSFIVKTVKVTLWFISISTLFNKQAKKMRGSNRLIA